MLAGFLDACRSQYLIYFNRLYYGWSYLYTSQQGGEWWCGELVRDLNLYSWWVLRQWTKVWQVWFLRVRLLRNCPVVWILDHVECLKDLRKDKEKWDNRNLNPGHLRIGVPDDWSQLGYLQRSALPDWATVPCRSKICQCIYIVFPLYFGWRGLKSTEFEKNRRFSSIMCFLSRISSLISAILSSSSCFLISSNFISLQKLS